MNKKRIALFSCAALVASGIGLNIQNALSDYGIGENSFSLVAVGPGSNSGSNSNSNSNSNWDSNTNTGPWDESDSNDLNNKKTKYTKIEHHTCSYACGGNPGDTKTLVIHSPISKTLYLTVQANGYASTTESFDWIECQKEGTLDECHATSCPGGEWSSGY